MPKICSVAGCNNNHLKERKISFFTFPDAIKDKDRRYKWIRACGRQNADGSEWLPTSKYIYICSQHFVMGKPNSQPHHPDYVPTIFSRTPRSVLKGHNKIKRYNSASRRRLILNEVCTNSDGPQPEEEEPCCQNLFEIEPEPTEGNEKVYDYMATPIPGWRAVNSEPTEVERLHTEINNLREERDLLKSQLNDSKTFDTSLISENDSKSKFYTGLCWSVFLKVFLFLNEGLRPARSGSVPNKEQLFITLVKLRQNTKFEYLADQVGIGKSTIIDIFWKWIGIINSKLSFMIQWPDREVIFSTTPPAFKCHFPRLTNIIDCFEIFIETPKNLKARAQCYSNYKKHTTVKFLVACNPRGCVIFLSKAWGGRVSDNEITRKSGYISPLIHHPGDQILADRGFMLREDIATECSAELILPAFTKGKKQLSAQDVEKSRQLASVRILVERVIGLMKTRFSILQGILPLKLVNSIKSESEDQQLSSADQIVRACAIITNLGDGIQS